MMYQESSVEPSLNPAQPRWAQIGEGAEKGDWDGKATERPIGNTGYALLGMKPIDMNLCQYFPGKTTFKSKNKTKPQQH